MFYKTGVDITNDKQMFNFLKGHMRYFTMNSWNGARSIANNVKLYNLGLSGDWSVAHVLLEDGEYESVNSMIYDWEGQHPEYVVYFNGRSGGYLVLKNVGDNYNILPEAVLYADNYDEYKEFCRDNFGSVKANRDELVYYTKLVQSFDKLCDMIRDYCNALSLQSFAIIRMKRAVEEFNEKYCDDLQFLGFSLLECNDAGEVNIGEIMTLDCLKEAFLRLVDCRALGYTYKLNDDIVVLQATDCY